MRIGLISIVVFVALQSAVSARQRVRPPGAAQTVTGSTKNYDELMPRCSPNGRWLAFEYHELGDPNYAQVGIMRLGAGTNSWRPLLKRKRGQQGFSAEFSWSPDSQWLAVITDHSKDGTGPPNSDRQLVKVNVFTNQIVRLTNFPLYTVFGGATAWLRSGIIVFGGSDQNIYGISQDGGSPQKLFHVPIQKCGRGTNTFAVSPNGERIALAMDPGDEDQVDECNALWIGDLRTGNLRRVPTTGLAALTPFWLDDDTILFSGVEIDIRAGKWLPRGIYRLSLTSGNLVRLLDELCFSPFVCDSGKTLYFSWGPKLGTKPRTADNTPILNVFYGFHIWKVPLRDVLR